MKTNFFKNRLHALSTNLIAPLILKNLPIHAFILIAFTCVVATPSCKKMDVLAPVAAPEKAQGFKWLIVNDEFTWADTRSISLDVIPLQTDSDLSALLYVKTVNDGTLITYNTSMKQALQIKFDLPTDQTKVKVVYGTIEKIIEITGNRIAFDFITPIPAQYE